MDQVLRSFVLLLAVIAWGVPAYAAEWQWFVEVAPKASTQPTKEKPRAFLWIPPECKQVRGVVFGQHNMEEEPILEHPAFRKAVAEIGFAEVWVAPGFDPYFRFDEGAGEKFDAMMKALADESGYAELATAPIVPIGHSAAASMPWYIAAWKPERVIAGISFSGQWPYVLDEKNAPQAAGKSVDTVPGIVTMGEYEWADENLPKGAKIRADHPQLPLSALGCPADGHFAAMDEKVEFLAFYLKKAAQYRLPDEAASTGAFTLRPIDPTKIGWLADRYRLNKDPIAPAAPVADYKGDPKQAFWYFDKETAKAAEAFQARHRGKAPLLGYVQDGGIVPQVNGTHQQVTLKFLPQEDGVTFKLSGDFLDTVPDGRPMRWVGKKAGEHIDRPTTSVPIDIRRICGPIRKLSADTWTLDFDRASFLGDRRGNEAWLVAIWPGDGEWKRMVQQSRLAIPGANKEGKPQKIAFPDLKDVPAGTTRVELAAKSDSGMPVRYYVSGGPAEVDGDTLKLLPIPVKAQGKPVKVTVVAWQFGCSVEPKVQSAEPVEKSFDIVPAMQEKAH